MFTFSVKLQRFLIFVFMPFFSKDFTRVILLFSQWYNLRHRAHSLQMPEHSTQSDSIFLIRRLYKSTY